MLGRYVLKRILVSIPVLVVISFVVFMMIQLPPGDFLDTLREQMQREGRVDPVLVEQYRREYRFEDPLVVQYFFWFGKFITFNMGKSMETGALVKDILKDLVPVTVAISVMTILFTWAIAIPFGITAAVRKNTVFDYLLTLIGLAAMATPGFVLALIFQAVLQKQWPNFNPSGIISTEVADLPWYSGELLADLAKHLFVPVVIVGIAGTAGMIRIMRANVIDELRKQYVLCARARGLHPVLVVLRYPVRVAINPFMSNIGLILPQVISGTVIVSIVLGLPTLGPVTLTSIQSQDTYLATSVVFIQCILAVIGILVSDIMLSLVDPRIKFEAK